MGNFTTKRLRLSGTAVCLTKLVHFFGRSNITTFLYFFINKEINSCYGKSSNKHHGAYSKTFQLFAVLISKLAEIMCQNLFTGRTLQNVV